MTLNIKYSIYKLVGACPSVQTRGARDGCVNGNQAPTNFLIEGEPKMSIFNDLVTLAKAGYTPDNVKEILKMSNENETKEKEEPKEKEKEPETKVYTTEKSEPDYKSLYESTKKELENIQNENTRDDMSKCEESIDDILENIKKAIC